MINLEAVNIVPQRPKKIRKTSLLSAEIGIILLIEIARQSYKISWTVPVIYICKIYVNHVCFTSCSFCFISFCNAPSNSQEWGIFLKIKFSNSNSCNYYISYPIVYVYKKCQFYSATNSLLTIRYTLGNYEILDHKNQTHFCFFSYRKLDSI